MGYAGVIRSGEEARRAQDCLPLEWFIRDKGRGLKSLCLPLESQQSLIPVLTVQPMQPQRLSILKRAGTTQGSPRLREGGGVTQGHTAKLKQKQSGI